MTTVHENPATGAADRNLVTAKLAYDHFLQGNIPAILAMCAENVVWQHSGNPSLVPFAGTFEGIPGSIRFFEAVGSSVQVTHFEPHSFHAEGNTVTNRVNIRGMVLASGKAYDNPVSVSWSFDDHGRITRYETFGDMSAMEEAFL